MPASPVTVFIPPLMPGIPVVETEACALPASPVAANANAAMIGTTRKGHSILENHTANSSGQECAAPSTCRNDTPAPPQGLFPFVLLAAGPRAPRRCALKLAAVSPVL